MLPKVASYLLAEDFLSRCLSALDSVLTPDTCLFYLGLAQDICCTELRTTVFTYLSRSLLELPHLTRCVQYTRSLFVVWKHAGTQRTQCLWFCFQEGGSSGGGGAAFSEVTG